MAPVVKELESREGIESIVLVTAQHRGMLDQVLEVFKIKPDYDLNIMKPDQTLAYITSAVLMGIEDVIIKERPDIVLVHGDTTTAMAAALAAFYQQVPVGHVEAGLRTYNKYETCCNRFSKCYSMVRFASTCKTTIREKSLSRHHYLQPSPSK